MQSRAGRKTAGKSLLFTTGYLTQRGKAEWRQMKLAIPNLEIRDIFETQIMGFFKENIREDGDTLNRLCIYLHHIPSLSKLGRFTTL